MIKEQFKILIQLNLQFYHLLHLFLSFISFTITCPKFNINKSHQLLTNQLNRPPNPILNADNTETDLTTTDHIMTTTTTLTITITKTMEIMTENPDTKISNVVSETSSVSSMMSPKSDTTPKFQKCQKNQNKNPMKSSTTKKYKNFKNVNSSWPNWEKKRKTPTKMVANLSLRKSKNKKTTLNWPKLVLSFWTLTKKPSKRTLRTLRIRLLLTREK